jgi:hypothetical protein
MADKALGIDFASFRNMLRRETRKALEPIKAAAVRDVPKLKQNAIYRKGKVFRIRGVVRDRIMVRRSKNAEKEGNVGAFVNVKPLPGNKYRKVGSQQITDKTGQTRLVGKFILTRKSMRSNKAEGFNNPFDPFYWQFLELGVKRRGIQGTRFLSKQRSMLPAAGEKLKEAVNRYFERRA